MIESALDYARRGWPVFPCEVGGKRPLGRLVQHGLKDAANDSEQIRRWWTAQPDANIGLVAGHAFDVLDVLDVDGPQALDALERSGPLGGPDIDGPTVATPRGWHVYLQATGRRNTVNLGSLQGVDWRGKGGYVVAPPSVKADGTRWEWVTGTSLDLGPDTPINSAPEWVLALIDRRPASPIPDFGGTRHGGRTGYGAAALERELGRLALAQEGTRNHQLNASAHSLGQLVASGHLDAEEVAEALLAVGRRIGLVDQECVTTIRSGMTAGMRTPRKVA